MYASQNKGYFPGPNASGYFILRQGLTDSDQIPDVTTIWDWQAPLASVMGIKFNHDGAGADRADRFLTLINHPSFICPDNFGVTAIRWSGSTGPNWMNQFTRNGHTWPSGAKQWQSYLTAMVFQFVNSNTPQPFSNPGQRTNGTSFYDPPPGYAPKTSRVGNASRKIYAADGGRYYEQTSGILDMDTSLATVAGGAWADVGPYSQFSNGFNRGRAPGNNGGGQDIRLLWARHGTTKANQAADAYKFNAVFFDGHVELLGDLEGSRPSFWLPKGSTIANASTEVQPDVAAKFGIPSGTYTVGE
jgi:prepilin-type processing-associated H-X9-DG protein